MEEIAPTNGTRRCVIEYRNLCAVGIGTYVDNISFQIILTDNPTNNLISVNYNDVATVLNGADAAIGIQRPGGLQLDRTSYAFNQSGSVYSGLSLAFALNSGTDPLEIDTDFDGLTDKEEAELPVPTDPRQPDTDGDGLTDGWEVDNHMNPAVNNDTDGIANNAANEDFDGDGLTNAQENDLGTSSLIGTGGDTDGDLTSDAAEFASGSDPNNAASQTAGDLVRAEFYFGDHSGTSSEKYCLRLSPMNGIDPRGTISMVNLIYGQCETKTNLLYRGEEYTVTLEHSGTTRSGEPDCDYTLNITVPQPSVVDDTSYGIIGEHGDGSTTTEFFAAGKHAYIRIGGLDLDIDLDYDGTVNNDDSEEKTEADPGTFTAVSNRVAIALRSTGFVAWTGTAELVVPTEVEVYNAQTGGSPLSSLTFSSLPQTLYVMSAEPGEYTLKLVPQGLDSGDAVNLTVVKVLLKSITYNTDEDVITDHIADFENGGGTIYSEPKWTIAHSYPITHIKGSRIGISVSVNVMPAGLNFNIFGESDCECLDFEGEDFVSDATDQIISLTAETELANCVYVLDEPIAWSVEVAGTRYTVGNSSNVVYVTWGIPTGSEPTFRRIDWACFLAHGASSPAAIANAIGPDAVSGDRFGSGSIFGNNPLYSSAWGILDPDPSTFVNSADYGSLSTLMKLNLEMLGVTGAEVRFIYACHDSWDGLSQTSNIGNEKNSNDIMLGFWFGNGLGAGWNVYEGCCVFDSKYWMGGMGMKKDSAYEVWDCVTCPNNDGEFVSHQCWYNDKLIAVDPPSGTP